MTTLTDLLLAESHGCCWCHLLVVSREHAQCAEAAEIQIRRSGFSETLDAGAHAKPDDDM